MSKLMLAIKRDRVVINKDLTTDPYNKRGKVGTVVARTTEGYSAIKFPDGVIGLYEDDTFHKVKKKR